MDQSDIIIRKWRSFAAIENDHPKTRVVFHQRHRKDRASPFNLNHLNPFWIAILIIKRIICNIVLPDDLAIDHRADCNEFRTGQGLHEPLQGLIKIRSRTDIGRNCCKATFVIGDTQKCQRRFAQTAGIFEYAIEDRAIVIATAADDFEDFARCFFPFKSFLNFTKLARVFDGNDCMFGEFFNQLYVRVSKWPYLTAADRDGSDSLISLHQGDCNA
nr:hypothetical protein [Ruegeria atlantica]